MARNIIEIVIQGTNNASGVLSSVNQSLDKFGQNLTRAGVGLSVATAPLTIFGATGLRVAGDFETTFTEISARTGIVGDDLAMLREQALQWGADTVFSGQQAADAFLQLLTTGMSAEDAITTMDAVLVGAAASGLDLGTTADRLTNIMAGMRLEADEGTYIVDRLGRASGSVGGGMQPMMEAMEASAGAAKTYGISMDELIPMLAIWSDAGLRGSEAGTQLRSMMVAMTANTETAATAWSDLGTSLYDADGAMRPMADVIVDIKAGLADMTEAEAARVLKDLAGSYGMTGLSALLASDGIDAMNAKIDSAASASTIADAQMSTFDRSVESLMGSVEALQITALTPFMEDVGKPFVDMLIENVNAVREWAKENPQLTNSIIMLGLGLIVLGPVLIAAGMAASGLGTALGLIFSPAMLVAGAIGAILFAANELYPGGLGQMLMDAATAAQQLAFMGLAVLAAAAEAARLFVAGFINTVRETITALENWVQTNIGVILGLGAGMIAVQQLGIATKVFTGIQIAARAAMVAYNAVVGAMSVALGAASVATGGLAAGMMAAAGPIIAVGAAIAGVIAQVHEFSRVVGAASGQANMALSDELAEGVVSRQQLDDQAFASTAAGFGGGIGGDIMARLLYSNVANAVADDGQFYFVDGGRAAGGPVSAGSTYLVGERGAELFVPDTSGTIIPNDMLGGMGGVTIENVTIHANSATEGQAAMRGALDEIQARQRARGGQ